MPIVIVFNQEDKEIILTEAARRQTVNEAKNLQGRNGGVKDGAKALKMHILGATGELAVASYLGLRKFVYLESKPKRGSSDLPPNIDVKTRSKHYYDLICQLDESQFKILVLVTVENNTALIHGWITSKQAMNKKWIKDPAGGRSAYFIPKSELLCMESLKDSDSF
jgi:hypothetical protein